MTTDNVVYVSERLKRVVVIENVTTSGSTQNEVVEINNTAKVIEHILDASSSNLEVKKFLKNVSRKQDLAFLF